VPGGRGNVDHAAPTLTLHGRDRLSQAEEAAVQVDRQAVPPVGVAHVLQKTRRQVSQGRLIQVADMDPGAQAREARRDRAPDVPSARGDQDPLAFNAVHAAPLPSTRLEFQTLRRNDRPAVQTNQAMMTSDYSTPFPT
jgi:hypothetical protein